MFKGKLKTFKNWPICTKQAIFTTKSSHEQVARASHQNTQEKIFTTRSSTHERVTRWATKISEFSHDWTFHLQTSRQTESRETLKTQILKNILSIFRDWDIDPPVSREKSLCGLVTATYGWTNPQLSRQNRATLFLKFLTFLQKQKTFQKQLKHSKIFLCLINKDWACENTFNQGQSHKWIWHLLNIDICDVCGYQQWNSP